jgi:hypothetical protein
MDTSSNIVYNRFTQRFVKIEMYTKLICKWFINEYEICNSGSSIDIEKIRPIIPFFLFSLTHISDFFAKSYNIIIGTSLDINNCIITKYTKYNTNQHTNLSSGFVCILFLSEKTDILFNDGLLYNMNQGDMIIYENEQLNEKTDILFNDGIIYNMNQGDMIIYKNEPFEIVNNENSIYLLSISINIK